MNSLTETTKREFSKRVLEAMNANSEELQAAGVDVPAISADLSGKVDEAFSAEERQLRARADAEAANPYITNPRIAREATANAYRRASDMVELIVGALGKDNALSVRLRGVRDEIANENARGRRKTVDVSS